MVQRDIERARLTLEPRGPPNEGAGRHAKPGVTLDEDGSVLDVGATMAHPLDRFNGDEVFVASDVAMLVVDDVWVIRAANPRYLEVTRRDRLDVLGVPIFEAFPDNPADPHADGVANLEASFESVLRTNRRHRMALQRHDLLELRSGGMFSRRFWTPVNSPLRDARGRAIGALHQVEDVTAALDRLLDGEQAGAVLNAESWNRLARSLASEVLALEADRTELGQLRTALTSRVVIEQAKGVVRAQWRVDAEEAFEVLRRWARSSGLSLHAVAGDVVHSLELPPPIVRDRPGWGALTAADRPESPDHPVR